MNLDAYRHCLLCPRQCGVDRTAGQLGTCRQTATLRIASASPHFGEEPSFSGTRGSGTIFFTGCSSRCFFCQNHQISTGGVGREVEPDAFRELALGLVAQGVHNLNLVSPDHFWPHVEWLAAELRARGVAVPFLFNGSGYQLPDMVSRYAESVDIFMPDLKFADPELARLCIADERYPVLALEAIRRMVALKGFLEPWDPTGAEPARRGVLVRHLVLPGRVENSLAVLRALRREFGPGLPVSIMSQFRPVPACEGRGLLTRPLAAAEYEPVCEEVVALGFEKAYVQPGASDEEFLPDFRREEPFRGNRRRRGPGGP